jgi:energy-coupling factor transport system permease protein
MDLLRSLPLGLYLEHPQTWLHRLDPRVKLAWLMSFLALPILATPFWRVILVVLLVAITLVAWIPLRVWRQQMGWLLGFCSLLFVLTAVFPDGLDVKHQPRLPSDLSKLNVVGQVSQPTSQTAPPSGVDGGSVKPPAIAPLPQPTDYSYVLFAQEPLKITRRSLDLAIRIATFFFTLVYSTNLYLLTTAPEEITVGLENLMQPLRRLKVPVTEITLTLTLSLRFIPLVLEEIQNLVRSVRTRAINWQKLGMRGSVQVWMVVAERFLENLLLRAEQIASAMNVRGFTSPNHHQVRWHQLRLRRGDWFAIGSLLLLWSLRFTWEGVT